MNCGQIGPCAPRLSSGNYRVSESMNIICDSTNIFNGVAIRFKSFITRLLRGNDGKRFAGTVEGKMFVLLCFFFFNVVLTWFLYRV